MKTNLYLPVSSMRKKSCLTSWNAVWVKCTAVAERQILPPLTKVWQVTAVLRKQLQSGKLQAMHPSRGIHRASLKAKNLLKRTILIVELHYKGGYLRRLSVAQTDSVTYECIDTTFCCVFKSPFKQLISFFVCVIAKTSFKNKFPLAAYAAMRLFVHSVSTHSDIKLVEWLTQVRQCSIL